MYDKQYHPQVIKSPKANNIICRKPKSENNNFQDNRGANLSFVDNRNEIISFADNREVSSIQRQVKVANHPVTNSTVFDDNKQKITSGLPTRFRKAPAKINAVLRRLKKWANDGNERAYASYKEAAAAAFKEVMREKNLKVKVPKPINLKLGLKKEGSPSPTSPGSATKKISKMRNIARKQSEVMDSDEGISNLRDHSKLRTIHYPKSGPNRQKYTVGKGGSFVLGGTSDGTYKGEIESAKSNGGMDDKQLATVLVSRLTDKNAVIPPSFKGGANEVNKLVAIILTAENTRATINIAAVISACNEVISGKCKNLYDSLSKNALLTKNDGGAFRSGYHKNSGVKQDDDFKEVASNQYDAMRNLAKVNEVNTADEEAMSTFFSGITSSARDVIKSNMEIEKD
ncbi:hypothetical protein [Shewanella sp. YLB-07]|uniref:hypothetical protein n=1 Tax=Shewanella sp. YLB-07 TaxID=2601268 RepID=UPI00128DE000|nr:hypothetical protein [Shewanella sp. YLB-07]MPY25004.1 hypothetical protein [Shewanella sp. YLB-07]